GAHELRLYANAKTMAFRIGLVSGQQIDSAGNPASVRVDAEDGDEFAITAVGANNVEVGAWTVGISVEDTNEGAVHTRYEALIHSHRKGTRPPMVRVLSSAARSLEESYISSVDSWRGAVACWSSGEQPVGEIDWEAGKLGDLEPAVDVRPAQSK